MKTTPYIPLYLLSKHYEVEMSFFTDLVNIGLIEVVTIEDEATVHQDKIKDLEKMIRFHHEMNINIEGIDVVFNLLAKIETLQNELWETNTKLLRYSQKEE
jgi:MerR HTH family regulatory protein